jgi:glycosyltransferase involved in cell wall biosynthesis
MRKGILFISTMASDPWGGSEELWTQTAVLLAKGVPVAASVHGWPQLDRRITGLSRAGVDLRPRPIKSSIFALARRYISGGTQIALDIKRSFGHISPSLVLISDGFAFPPIELAELCVAKGWPFATVAHANRANFWPLDEATRLRKVLPLARRCFFVSKENQALAERQLGYDFDNAEVVRNPLTIDNASAIPWPHQTCDQALRLACVARLDPTQKGQDILLDVLASPCWRERNWRLTLYGDGPNRDVLGRLVERLNLQARVSFAGHVAVEKIWRENHILVMPSRYEGMPITVIEAMFCGRPVVATSVGGNSEVIRDGVTGFLAEAAVAECYGRALERMWTQRHGLEEIGKLAAADIREFIRDDPVEIFAEKLQSLANLQR